MSTVRALAIGLFVAAISMPVAASAHEETPIDDLRVTMGWLEEPAYSGLLNAVEVSVTSDDTGKGVAGASLSVEVILGGPNGGTRSGRIDLVPVSPGEYRAPLIPTTPGTYTFHLSGQVNATVVDLQVTSGPDAFDDVQDSRALAFPASSSGGGTEVKLDRVVKRVDKLSSESSDLDTRWHWTMLLAAAASVLGLVSVILTVRPRHSRKVEQ